MTKLERLEIENELMRDYRLWYNPQNISDEELRENIKTQKELVKILEEAYKENPEKEVSEMEKEENAKVLLSEVMKMVIWEDIIANRDPNKRAVQLED